MRNQAAPFKLSELSKDSHARDVRGYRYLVDGTLEGKRKKRYFHHGEKEDAEAYRDAMNTKAVNVGTHTASILSDDSFIKAASQAQKDLEPWGRTIAEAVKHYINHLKQTERSVSVADLKEEFYLSKQRSRKQKSPRYLYDLNGKLAKFVETHGKRTASTITTEELHDWLEALPVASLVTVKGYFRAIRGMFRFAEKKSYVSKCPTRAIDEDLLTPLEEQPEILTIKQVCQLLDNASSDVIPALVFGLYCGIRTSEVERMNWGHVNIKRRLVTLPASITKIGKPRHVDIPKNAIEWLTPYMNDSSSIRPAPSKTGHKAFKKEMGRLAKVIGLDCWDNHLRHSFGSYHYAAFQDIAKTAAQLGHQSTQITWKHYYQLADPEDAKRFWEVRPTDMTQKIIAIS